MKRGIDVLDKPAPARHPQKRKGCLWMVRNVEIPSVLSQSDIGLYCLEWRIITPTKMRPHLSPLNNQPRIEHVHVRVQHTTMPVEWVRTMISALWSHLAPAV